ncbi:MAG TPA: hypothetical protein VI685_24070 [Candidatus Angelobacter sp.]
MRPTRTKFLIATGFFLMLLVALRGPSEAGRLFTAQQNTATQSKPAAPAPADPSAGVEVTAQALPASKFCALGPRAYVVYVPMDITVANGRRTPIILSQFLHVQRVLVGKTTNDVQAKKYELATPVRTFRSFGQGATFGPQPTDDSWVVLKHNQTYEFTAVEGIPVRNNSADEVAGTVYPGDLAFSIELQTWPFSRDPSALQKDWARFGDIIIAPVIGYPTLIKLPANPPTEKCGLPAP